MGVLFGVAMPELQFGVHCVITDFPHISAGFLCVSFIPTTPSFWTFIQYCTNFFWVYPLCPDYDKILPCCAGRVGSRTSSDPLLEGRYMGICVAFWYVLLLLAKSPAGITSQLSSRWTHFARRFCQEPCRLLYIRMHHCTSSLTVVTHLTRMQVGYCCIRFCSALTSLLSWLAKLCLTFVSVNRAAV